MLAIGSHSQYKIHMIFFKNVQGKKSKPGSASLSISSMQRKIRFIAPKKFFFSNDR